MSFQGDLTDFLGGYDLGKLEDPSLKTSDIARYLLSSGEMQAIHRFINARLDEVLGNRVGDAPAVKWLSERGLPQSVIGWVLDV